MTKRILFLLLLMVVLTASYPADFPPRVMNPGDTFTYRVTTTGGIFMIYYYRFSGSSCQVYAYVWYYTSGWYQYVPMITIPEGSVFEETSAIPRMACVTGHRHIQISSSSTDYPKFPAPNPSEPLVFLSMVLKP